MTKRVIGEERICSECRELKPASSFYKDRGMICYSCRTAKSNLANLYRGRRRKMEIILSRGGRCLDCGIDLVAHPEIADFDHRPDEGRNSKLVSKLAKRNLERFLTEIALCDLVCANCHRIRTFSRLNTTHDLELV